MITLLLLPLAVPFCAPFLARYATRHLSPAGALWSLTLTAVVLASCSAGALGILFLSGSLGVPLFAGLAELTHPLRTAPAVIAMPLAAFSSGALAVSVWAMIGSTARQITALRRAKALADSQPTAGDLCVIDTPHPDAYALPGRPSRIVVTTGMLRSLSAAERQALFAHERAHLAGRHHYFLVAADLAAHCHPGLRPLRSAIQLAAERTADEAAAGVTGDRRLTAQAIGRAALATHASQPNRPAFTPAATSGPVPQRVRALLAKPARCQRSIAVVSMALLLAGSGSLLGAAVGTAGFHDGIETAQGEASPR
ncbi:M56 family metallopeptidase [Streptomyces violascens]|uniref:M56 family metallopeptidase n=1 Tax=Streptomyces violascens TaxID=67381 RepID=UPI00379AC59F